MIKKLLPAVLALSVIVAPLPGPATSTVALAVTARAAGVSLPVEQFTLENGLKVYLSPNPQEPRFSARVVINAGAKRDPVESTGIAHYLEHMLFKGTDELGTVDYAKEKPLLDEITRLYDEHSREEDETKRLALLKQINQLAIKSSQYAIPGEFDRLYNRLGAQGLNAYTSHESTVYEVDLPKNRLEHWAMIESERFKDPVFRLFQSELETVYEEKNRSMDNKEWALNEAVNAQLYQKHPYGQNTVLGTIESLKNPSLSKMYAFYHRYYVPNNMALVLSGDFDPREARTLIKKYFSAWKRSDVPQYQPPREAPIEGIRKVTVPYKGEEKTMIAFRTAPYASEDRAALRMIDMLLDNNETGLINLDLVKPQKVRAAGSFPDIETDGGVQYLWGIPAPGQSLAEVDKLLLGQLEKIKKGAFDETLMQGIALGEEIRTKRGLESNEGRVGVLIDSFLKGRSPAGILADTAKLRLLKKQDVMRVARKYFGSDYVLGWRVDQEPSFPKITKPELEKVALNPNQQSDFVSKAEKLAAVPIQPRWVNFGKDFQVKNYDLGVLQYHVTNPVNDLFNLTISYDYGDKHYPNFSRLMGELNAAGTYKLSSDEVAKKFYAMGVSYSFEVGDYDFQVKLSGIDEQFEPAVALIEQVLWHARLDENRLKAKVENWIKTREDKMKDGPTVRSALRNYILFGARSPFVDRPTNQALRQLSIKDYPRMVEQLRKQNFEIQYSGRLPMDRVTSLLKKYHEPRRIAVPLLKPRPQPAVTYEDWHDKPVKIFFTHHPSVQAHLDLVLPGDEVNPRERALCDLYDEYIDGGMGAIMFQEVREARSLAYSTYAQYSLGGRLGDRDQMQAYIGTQADKAVEALKLFIELMKTPPRSQAQFERALMSLINQYGTNVIPFRSVPGTVRRWADLGLDADPRPARLADLKEKKLDDVFGYLQAKIASRPLTFTLVGDRTKLDMASLKKLGDLEEVPLERLFTN